MINFFRSLFASKAPPAPPVPRVKPRGLPNNQPRESAVAGTSSAAGNYYEALNNAEHRTALPYLTPQTMIWLRGLGRHDLALLSRYLYENNGLVSYAVGQIKHYSSRVSPLGDVPDKEWNRKANEAWRRWARVADVTGRFTYSNLCDLLLQHRILDGDLGTRFVNVIGIPQIEVIEGCRIGNLSTLTQLAPDTIDGVKIDASGRVVGYQVWTGKGVGLQSEFSLYDANSMKLWYDPDYYSSYRGITALRRGDNDVRDHTDIKGFTKLRNKISSALAGVLEGDGEIEEDVWGDDTGPDGQAPEGELPEGTTPHQAKITTADVLGGEWKQIPEGLTLKQVDVAPTADTVEFLNTLAGLFVMSLDYPPAFFLDDKLTGPNTRSVNGKAQRKFDREIEIQTEFARWCWIRVIAFEIEIGNLAAVPGWDNPQFRLPAKISIDAGRDSSNEREDVSARLMTRREHFGNRDEDWETETDQSVQEDDYIIERLKEQAARTGVPMDTLLTRWGFEVIKKEPKQNEDKASK